MSSLIDLPLPLVPADEQPLSVPFTLLLLVHIPASLCAVLTGALAARSRKGPGRHPLLGTSYYAALALVFVTATGMGILRWAPDRYLIVLGTLSFAAASLGYGARKIRWKGWLNYHISGMSLSYVLLLTAFYVDNGPRLPIWNQLPTITYWTLPSLIGLPLALRALRRHAHRVAHWLR